jgi:hypothetical protein
VSASREKILYRQSQLFASRRLWATPEPKAFLFALPE